MKLEWIASVLHPESIVPHPNLPDSPSYSHQPHVALASLVYGRTDWRAPLEWLISLEEDTLSPAERAVRAVVEAHQSSTVRSGVSKLVEVLDRYELDVAAHVAVTLLAVVAAAEIEEEELCEHLLNTAFSRTTAASGDDYRVLHLCLTQQSALRRRDANRDWHPHCIQAIQLSESLLLSSNISRFGVRPSAPLSSDQVMRDMLLSMQMAIWSLAPSSFFAQESDSEILQYIPTTESRLSAAPSQHFLAVEQNAATEYSQYIAELFDSKFKSTSVTFGRAATDQFNMLLQYELYGSGGVYAARKELALYRLVRWYSNWDATHLSDCLRLLRDANAESEIKLALNVIKQRGPLRVLGEEARAVILHRCSETSVRPADLLVLIAASELLTTGEAAFAFQSVLEHLENGSPLNISGRFASASARMEEPLLAAAHLANQGNREEDFLTFAWRIFEDSSGNDILDMFMARALRLLNWSNLPTESVEKWSEWSSQPDSHWADSRTVVRVKNGGSYILDDQDVKIGSLSDVADYLNDSIRGLPLRDGVVSRSAPVVKGELARIRADAARGSFSGGGPSAAELAVVLIKHGATELWPDVVAFLLDLRVSRGDRSGAFERLALETIDVPEEYRTRFEIDASAVLEARSQSIFDQPEIVPYPEALRFLAVSGILNQSLVFSAVNELAGSSDPQYRTEAARTVAVLASTAATSWLLTLAIQLGYDEDVETKAFAGNAIAKMHPSSIEVFVADDLTSRTLSTLLSIDGILVPLMIIRGLSNSSYLSDVVREAVWQVATEHASSRVRMEARRLLVDS